MLVYVFAFILSIRAVFWAIVGHRAHEIQKEVINREARGLVAAQKFAALSFLLETAFWFMIIIPNTPLSIRQASELTQWVVVGLFAFQILPASFAWLWWTNRMEMSKANLDNFQALFGVITVGTIIVGIFIVLFTVLSGLG